MNTYKARMRNILLSEIDFPFTNNILIQNWRSGDQFPPPPPKKMFLFLGTSEPILDYNEIRTEQSFSEVRIYLMF